MSYCGHCGHPTGIPLPVEPLYSLETAAALAPLTLQQLYQWLSRHRRDPQLGPPLYRWFSKRRVRYLTASDVRYLRSRLVAPQRPPKLTPEQTGSDRRARAAGGNPGPQAVA